MELKIVKESEVVKENNAVEECSEGRKVLGILAMVGMGVAYAIMFSNSMDSSAGIAVGGGLGLCMGSSFYRIITKGNVNGNINENANGSNVSQ